TEPQVSEPLAEPFASGLVSPVHSTVVSPGQVMDGGVVSTIVIVCVQVEVFPQSSVTVQVRLIVPVLPQAGVKESSWPVLTEPQVSEPLAEPFAAGVVSPVHSTVVSLGQVMLGTVVSTMVIVCEQVEVFPQSSV